MSLLELRDDYIEVFSDIRIVSIFDTINYDFFDIDVLSRSQRDYLIKRAKPLGFTQRSGKWLSHANGTQVLFPPFKLFNRNFVSFKPEMQDEHTWLAVTPTQAAYLLLENPNCEDQDIHLLMMKQPFNLERLGLALEAESSAARYKQLLPELNRLLARAQVMLKNKLPLDRI